jgi:FG-GAP repeat
MRCAIVRNTISALVLSAAFFGVTHAAPAQPKDLSDADWSSLQAAMITFDAPYKQLAELAPPAPGLGGNEFGIAVAAWFDSATGVRWAVVGADSDDNSRGAAYVFRLDPGSNQWHQVARLVGADGNAGDFFGSSVAINGNTVAIGAPLHVEGLSTGATYIFVRDAAGHWTQQGPTLIVAGNSGFGRSVALEGDTLAAGAPNLTPGYVFMYQRVGTTWSSSATPFPPDMPADARFGWSVALNGNRLLVGAPYSGGLAPSRGSAYVFAYDSATSKWNFQQKLQSYLDGAAYDYFGWSVALSGETIAIGAPGRSSNTGAVYSFNYDTGLSSWVRNPTLLPADGASGDRFGYSVALDNTTLVVGSPLQRDTEGDHSGAVYIYTGSASAWTKQVMLSTENDKSGEESGYSIAFAGDILLTGAPYAALDVSYRGRVRSFQRAGSAWTEQPAITAISNEGEYFGPSVAISGNTAVVSAPAQASISGVGVANIFVRDASTGMWQWQASLPHPQASYGYTSFRSCAPVAIDGDTVLVGVPSQKFGSNDGQGAVYVYGRSGTTWSMRGTLADLSGHAADYFGCSIALSGNTAVIGAPGLNAYKGGAYVFSRTTGAWVQQRVLTATDAAVGDEAGLSAAISGDTILVGAPFQADDRGAAYIFGPTGTAPVKKLIASDGFMGDRFGASVALSGVTALIGAPGKLSGLTAAGRAYLFTGSAASWNEQKKFDPPSAEGDGYFGNAAAIDGTTAAIGEWGHNTVHIFTRHGATWTARSDAKGEMNSQFGVALALAGPTIMIGAPTTDNAGRAYIASDADLIFVDDFQ